MEGWKEMDNGKAIFIEDGMVVRATKNDAPASVYRWEKSANAWINACPVKCEIFQKGYKTGRYEIM